MLMLRGNRGETSEVMPLQEMKAPNGIQNHHRLIILGHLAEAKDLVRHSTGGPAYSAPRDQLAKAVLKPPSTNRTCLPKSDRYGCKAARPPSSSRERPDRS